MRLEDVVDAYLGKWLSGLPPKDATIEWYRERYKRPYATLGGNRKFWDLVTPRASQLLWDATDLLLERAGEQRRVQRETARRCLVEAQESHLTKAKKTGRLSADAVVAGATKRLSEVKRATGSYTVPVSFAPSAKDTNYRIGPAAILSRSEFQRIHKAAIDANGSTPGWFGPRALEEWNQFSERYDHFILVDISGHETEMAWRTARDVADYVLNLIRMRFGYYHMDDVRVGGGFIWETKRAKVYFDEAGSANLSLSNGPWASHLHDGWVDDFTKALGNLVPLFAGLGRWMASGDSPTSPVLERLRYANALIAEAFSEPHDRIRLVRLVAALEALAVLPREEKTEGLAWRCALAGGWTDCGRAVEIVDDVRYAYQVRNAIVHGDGANSQDVSTAFYRLERHLERMYVGFLTLYAKTQNQYRPQHIRQVRRAFDKHIEGFFWDPEEVW